MIRIKINGQAYQIPENSGEVSLANFIDYCKLQANAPKEFSDYYLQEERTAEAILAFNAPQHQPAIIGHYIAIVRCFLDIPKEVLGKASPVQLTALAHKIMMACIPSEKEKQGLVGPTIAHGGEVWQVPKQFMRGETVGSYLEAAQFLQSAEALEAGQWEVLPQIMAIILRLEGEEFSDELVKERAPQFAQWPLSIAYKVGFFLRRLSKRLKILLKRYSLLQQIAQAKS